MTKVFGSTWARKYLLPVEDDASSTTPADVLSLPPLWPCVHGEIESSSKLPFVINPVVISAVPDGTGALVLVEDEVVDVERGVLFVDEDEGEDKDEDQDEDDDKNEDEDEDNDEDEDEDEGVYVVLDVIDDD